MSKEPLHSEEAQQSSAHKQESTYHTWVQAQTMGEVTLRYALLNKQAKPVPCTAEEHMEIVVPLSGSKHPVQADYNWPARVELAGGKFICLVSPSGISKYPDSFSSPTSKDTD